MAATFDYSIMLPHLEQFEGGLVYIEGEGQYTNRGVQQTTYYVLKEKLNLESDFFNLSENDYRKIVKHYWDKATDNNNVRNKNSAKLLFHAQWGSGYYSIKRIQKALKMPSDQVDGYLGSVTVAYVNSTIGSAIKIYNALAEYYLELVQSPRYSQFKNGWFRRLETLEPTSKVYKFVILIILLLLGSITLLSFGKKGK